MSEHLPARRKGVAVGGARIGRLEIAESDTPGV